MAKTEAVREVYIAKRPNTDNKELDNFLRDMERNLREISSRVYSSLGGNILDLEGLEYTSAQIKQRLYAAETLLNSIGLSLDEHLLSKLPHYFEDVDTEKVYRYGFQVSEGCFQIVYEEVVSE